MTDTIIMPRAVVERVLDALCNTESVTGEQCEVEYHAIRALRAALEQSQVEQPVAWAVMQGGAICWETDYPFSNEPGWCDSDQQSVPLYTHPQPPRQSLTDEQIDKLDWGPRPDEPMSFKEALREFARAIEAAHGVGGKK